MARSEPESEPEQNSDDDSLPAGVAFLARYPIRERSLGNRYRAVFDDPLFNPEGILVWMHKRCADRVNGGLRVSRNAAARRDIIAGMLRDCGRGLGYDDRFANMVDNVIAMEDLTDDEQSPTHVMSEQQVLDLTLQCQQAFELALQSDIRQRSAEASGEASSSADAERLERGDADSERSENDAERLDWYMRDGLDEVSDHEYWHELHYGD
eukprot:s3048_g17.t1